jgi:molybdopterin-guanine dinucleotide biosynthesis protein B
VIELGIVGAKNSGKTTLVEELIGHLSESGLRVGTMKHTSHNHEFDTPGKDSYRHRAAGAALTVASSAAATAIFAPPSSEITASVDAMLQRHCDVCLVEGDRSHGRPKLLLTQRVDKLKNPFPGNIRFSYGPPHDQQAEVHFELDQTDQLMKCLLGWFRQQIREEQNVAD